MCGLKYRTCGSQCHGSGNEHYVCLAHGQVKSNKQISLLKNSDVIAGHLWFGLHRYVQNAVYVTCLRRPLDTRVSAKLYIHVKLELKAFRLTILA